jgi:uncharacterized short protein YbdD (DUF466 family)
MRWREALKRFVQTTHLMVGVPDYERYLAHRVAEHPGEPAMSRSEFHRHCTERRFGGGASSISRCC